VTDAARIDLSSNWREPHGPWIVGHRGAPRRARENTIESFDWAESLGVDAIEFDVRQTRDGEAVVFHDDDVSLGNQHVPVRSFTTREIEKLALPSEQGEYRIIDLRPGAYVLKFSLAGFTTVKRDGIDLPASFTATVNVDLSIGDLEETVIVSGQSSTVDVTTVSLDNPDRFPPTREVWLDHKLAWEQTNASLAHCAQGSSPNQVGSATRPT